MKDHLNTLNVVPSGLLNRWFFYKRRYGVIHAAGRFIGSRVRWLWPFIGELCTKKYRNKWLSTAKLKMVNLGGGGNCLSGALTVDIDPRSDAYVDLTKPLPFFSNQIDYIICEEAIEHISKDDAKKLLKECHRVLTPGGVIRISTPNLSWIAKELVEARMTADIVNEVFYGHGHRYLYTTTEMIKMLNDAEFKRVVQSHYRDESSPLGNLDTHADRFKHSPELSQYQDAYK